MFCNECRADLSACVCGPERDEALRKLAYDPAACLAFRWCRSCDKHVDRCRCSSPDLFLISGGREIRVKGAPS